MLNVHFIVLAILELALIHQCLFEPAQLAFPLFTAPSSISFLRRFAPRSGKRRRNSLVDSNDALFANLTESTNNLSNRQTTTTTTTTDVRNPFYEFYRLPPNDFLHSLLPVLQSPTIEILNHLNHHLSHPHSSLNNDLAGRLDNRLDRLDRLSHPTEYNHHQLINSNHLQSAHLHHQPILIHSPSRTVQRHYSFYHLHPHHSSSSHPTSHQSNRFSNHHLPIVNQSPFALLSKVQQLKHKLKQPKGHTPSSKLDYLNKLKSLKQFNKSKFSHLPVQLAKFDQQTTISPLNANGLTTISTSRTGYLQIGSTAHQNQFSLDTEGEDYLDNNNNLENNSNSLDQESTGYNQLSKLPNNDSSTLINNTGSGNQLTPTVTNLIKNDLEQLFKQLKPNFVNFNHHQTDTDDQLDLKSKYAYDLIGSNSTITNFDNQDINNQNVQVDFRERTAPDSMCFFVV